MSYTTIYQLGKDPKEIAEFKNAHRGAMYVWNQIAKDYFGLEHFPMFPGNANNDIASKIWNFHTHCKNIPDYEMIVMASTMDMATVDFEGLPKLIEAFVFYGSKHPNSSFLKQAHCIKKIELQPGDMIAWKQTSCGDFWGDEGYDEETEEPKFYDTSTGDKHFDVIEQFTDWKGE